MEAIKKILSSDFKIPSLPGVAIRVLEAVKSEKMSFDLMAKIISSDPALSARTLSVANTSCFGLRKNVNSIQAALTILGTNVIKNIALSFSLANEFYNKNDNYFDYSLFWRGSLTSAVAAQLIASSTGRKNDDLFITALLQDIGTIIMYLYKPRDYIKLLNEKKFNSASSIELEQNIYGFDHQQVSVEVLKKWGLSENIYKPICFHHDVEKAPREHMETSHILFCSQLFSSFYNRGNKIEKLETVKNILNDKFEFAGESFSTLVDDIAIKSSELMSFFDIEKQDIKPYSEILQDANHQLSELNLTNAQMIIELNRSKEKIKKLNYELERANVELSIIATRDGLTGLYNHKFFKDSLEAEIERAGRYKKELSLVFFDIDHFKKTNDNFGHLAGDHVLKTIGGLLVKVKRKTDIISRYGGEEFAVILPETNLEGASIFAERLRKFIEKTEFNFEGQKIKITVSLGVTAFTADSKNHNKDELIATADKALYESKNNGRNRVTVRRSV